MPVSFWNMNRVKSSSQNKNTQKRYGLQEDLFYHFVSQYESCHGKNHKEY